MWWELGDRRGEEEGSDGRGGVEGGEGRGGEGIERILSLYYILMCVS